MYTGMTESVNVSRELFPSDGNCQEQMGGGGEGVREGGGGREDCGGCEEGGKERMGNIESDVESVLEGVARLSVVGGGREEGGGGCGLDGDKMEEVESGDRVEKGEVGEKEIGDKVEEGRVVRVEEGEDADRMEEGEVGKKMEEHGKRGGERSNSPYSVPEQEPHMTPTTTHRKKTTFLLGYGGLTCQYIHYQHVTFSDL